METWNALISITDFKYSLLFVLNHFSGTQSSLGTPSRDEAIKALNELGFGLPISSAKSTSSASAVDPNLPAEYVNSSLFKESMAASNKKPEVKSEQEFEDELQLALALSQSEAEAKDSQKQRRSSTGGKSSSKASSSETKKSSLKSSKSSSSSENLASAPLFPDTKQLVEQVPSQQPIQNQVNLLLLETPRNYRPPLNGKKKTVSFKG